MNWLNLEIKVLRSVAYIGSAPSERATWINLLAFCCEQENGGVIEGSKNWKDRQWQQLCGVTRLEVERATKLLAWDSGDLVVSGYPKVKEAEVRSKREAGREGGLRSAEARSLKTEAKGASTASSSADPHASQGASTEGERKEKEKGKRKESTAPPNGVSSEHALFAKLWTDSYPAHHGGESYAFQGGKDGTAIKNLLATSGKSAEELQRVFVAAWQHPSGFHSKLAASICGFNSKFNEIRQELNAMQAKPSRAVAPAHNGTDETL